MILGLIGFEDAYASHTQKYTGTDGHCDLSLNFPGPGKDYSNCDLSAAFFHIFNFDFTGSDFSFTDLDNSRFDGSTFTNSDFTGARFSTGTSFNMVIAINTDFSETRIRTTSNTPFGVGTDFTGSNFSGADFGFVKFASNSIYTNTIFTNADLAFALLINVNLSNIDFTNADFSSAAISGVDFSGSDFTGADFAVGPASTSVTQISNTNFSFADLTNADFARAFITNVDLTGASLGCLNHPICESGDLILVSAQPIQAVEGVSAFILDKPTVFKAVIKNTFPEDKTFLVTLFLDDTALVSIDEILVKANCTATYYFPSPSDPTACDGKPLPASQKSFIPNISEGLRNFNIRIDSGNKIEEPVDNNELESIHRWTKTRDLVILYVPIKHFFNDMKTPCPPDEREFFPPLAFELCSPDPARILTPIQWVDLVYPIDDIQYIPLLPYINLDPRVVSNIPGLWNELDLMRKNWIMSNPGVDREVVLYGWLPTGTITQGLGNSGTNLGFGDENIGSIGNCADCGDMHINDLLLAHEVGHMLDVKHPTDEARGCTGFNAPFTSVIINQEGYHIPTGHVKDPSIHEHMMGAHCSFDDPTQGAKDLGIRAAQEKWTSPEGWDDLAQLMGGTVVPLAATPLVALSENTMIVSGIISTDGNSGQLDPIYKSMLVADVTDGPFTLEILDSENNVIHTQNFATPEQESIFPEGDPENLSFFLVLPFLEGTDSIQILNGAIVLDSVQVTPNSPTVSVLFPNGGETLSGLQTIMWDGSDLDGDDLFYKLEYSFDEGTIWNLIAKDLSTTSQAVNFDQFPGNENTALIRVTVTDGFNTNSDTSDAPFFVANKPPLVVIIRPQTDIEINSVDGVSLQGEAADVEDGVPPPNSSFSWSSSIEGILGSGRILNVNLSLGIHTITLEVIDSDGNLGSESIIITVLDPCFPPLSGDWIVSESCTINQDINFSGKVTVQPNVLLTINSGTTFTISSNNLFVQFGGAVLVESGGKLSLTG